MRMDCYNPENQTPHRALSEARDAIKAVHAAFGSPGYEGISYPEIARRLEISIHAAWAVVRKRKSKETNHEDRP